jgi:hypothetical protein
MIKKSIEQRFWSKIIKTDGCWLWTGANYKGYGKFAINKKEKIWAHRMSWLLNCGPIPDGLCICHHCDTPSCVNPSHLFIGTIGDNNRDAFDKGRNKPWGGNRNCKLTDDNIRFILSSYKGHDELASIFNVLPITILNVRRRKTYKHIT